MNRHSNPSPSWLYSLLFLLYSCFALGDRAIYLVMLEREPVAFHKESASPTQSHENFEPESESSKAHAERLVESHDQLLEATLDAGAYTKLYSFHHIVNGFAVHTSPSQVKRLKKAHEVLRIERDRGVKLMTTYTPYFLGLPRGVWAHEGGVKYAGECIVIGVVDTGINPDHPSFAYDPSKPYNLPLSGVCDVGPQFPVGSCNGKIVSARFFSAGAAAIVALNASRLSPFDEVGHGSHVASVAAGNWGVPVTVNNVVYGLGSGMAPRARLAIYKAIYPEGGTLADVVSAIEQAARDQVDVLVLSVGPDEPPEDTITFMNIFDVFLLYARRAGVFVVQAAGNKGPAAASVVSFSPWAVGVAASTTSRCYPAELVLGNNIHLHGVGLSAPTPGNGLLQFKLVAAKDAAKVNNESSFSASVYAEECQHPEALESQAVQDSILICMFSEGFLNGTSTMAELLNTAIVLGLAGFIFAANPEYGDFMAEPLPFTVPGIMLPGENDTKVLFGYYENQTKRDSMGNVIEYHANAAIREGRFATLIEEAPVVSRFSSRGPNIVDSNLNPADVLKPDILAPGHQIWGAWSPSSILNPILSGNNFALLSGTSMATPHVAGIAALIKQSHPSWTPAMIASALSTTAKKHDNRGSLIKSQGFQLHALLSSIPFDYGAGFVNPSSALNPGLVFFSSFEDYISFLCSLPNIDPSTVCSSVGMACNKTLPTPSDLNLPSITVAALFRYRSIQRTVFNVATHSEAYLCSVLPPEGVEVNVKPRWFTIHPQATQELVISLNVTHALNDFSFGEIVLVGSLNHIVRLPLLVRSIDVMP